MLDSTLKFLENYLSAEQKELLHHDPAAIRDSMSGKTDLQRF